MAGLRVTGERVVSVLGAPRVHGGGSWERVRTAGDALTLCQEAI
jgi:hypothetical protein